MSTASLSGLAGPSGALTPAERAADARASYDTALYAIAHRHDLPDSATVPPARSVTVPLAVIRDGKPIEHQ